MTLRQSRKSRGYKTQDLLAEWWKKHGHPFAESTGAGRQGVDITGLVGLACEVKATASESLTDKLNQAVRNAGENLAFVVYRPNGYGPAKIGDWPVILRLEDFSELLRASGFGGEWES